MLLTIVKFPEKASFAETSRTIDEKGGTIGRARGNDWVLPDPDRYLSSRHAEVVYDNGQFFLEDLSTNGTFYNGGEEPIGKGQRVVLKDGDRVVMGEYEFQVSLWSPDLAGDDPFAPASAPAPVQTAPVAPPVSNGPDLDDPWGADVAPMVDAPGVIGNAGADPFGGLFVADAEPFDPLKAFDAPPPGAGPIIPADPFFDAPAAGGNDFFGTSEHGADLFGAAPVDPFAGGNTASNHVPMPEQAMNLPNMIPDDWDLDEDPAVPSPPAAVPVAPVASPLAPPPTPQMPAPMPPVDSDPTHRRAAQAPAPEMVQAPVTPPAVPMPPPQVQAPQPTAPATVAVGGAADEALFAALGIDASRFNATERMAIATVTGKFVREAVSGLIRVLGSRSSIKNEFRMNVTTIQPIENNPLKFSATVDDAIELMFVKRSKSYKPPIEAVQEGFEGIADHQVAVIAGMRAAFENILHRFDPEQLQQRFDKQQKGGIIPGSKKARYWEAFEALYEELSQDEDEAFQMLFGDEFVQSYESQLTKLAIARKKGSKSAVGNH